MDDFRKYAVKHLGMNGLVVDEVIKSQANYLNPYILEERQLNFALHYYAQSDWIFDFSIPYSVLGAGDDESKAYSAPLYFCLKDANYKTLCSISVRPNASYKETAENSAA